MNNIAIGHAEKEGYIMASGKNAIAMGYSNNGYGFSADKDNELVIALSDGTEDSFELRKILTDSQREKLGNFTITIIDMYKKSLFLKIQDLDKNPMSEGNPLTYHDAIIDIIRIL